MIIHKKRIRNLSPYLSHIRNGESIIFGILSPERFTAQLNRMGFDGNFQTGQSLLPAGVFGPISRYNSEGKNIVHKGRPMETAYREAEWHWTEFHGPYERVDQSKIVDVPYKRYPRTFVPPPAIELTFAKNAAEQTLLIGPVIKKDPQNLELLTHTANLLLEIFGECQIFTESLDSFIKLPITRVNWEIFPQGEVPWEKLQKHIDPIIKKAPKGNQPVIWHRFEAINKMSPDFIAVGKGGFHGYVVHGFTQKGIFVLESIYYGNATYVFGEKWEDLSQKTKAEVLNEKLQKERVIHSEGWDSKLKMVFA